MSNPIEFHKPSFEHMLEYLNNRKSIIIPENGNYFEFLKSCKEYYDHTLPQILEYHMGGGKGFYRPYPCDWMKILNVPEFDCWAAIRRKGGLPLYPQFPVLNYFIDFANPHLKIGVEIDGKEFHDVEKDTIRDTKLKKEGWIIIRISASEMMRSNYTDVWDDDGSYDENLKNLRYWMLKTGDGVLEAIRSIYFNGWCRISNEREPNEIFTSYCQATLYEHMLVK